MGDDFGLLASKNNLNLLLEVILLMDPDPKSFSAKLRTHSGLKREPPRPQNG